MTRRHKKMVAGLYVVAAGLLLALGAAARYSKGGTGQLASSENASQARRGMMSGQMAHGMMGRNQEKMMATRRKMRDIVDELLENQVAMDKARSVHRIQPLLKKNRELLNRLDDEMEDSWGMHRHMHGATHEAMHGAKHEAMHGKVKSGRMSSPALVPKTGEKAPAAKPGESAAQSRLIARGKEVYLSHTCHICHGPTGKGTLAGVSLIGIGKKYSAEKIADLIRHPKTTKMPSFSQSALPSADLKAVVAYLETLKK